MPKAYDGSKQVVLDKDPTRQLAFGGLASDDLFKGVGTSILKLFQVTGDEFWKLLGFDPPPETTDDYLNALVDLIVHTAMNITSWLASQIPGLDASKITSGLFPQSQIEGLEQELSDLGAAIIAGDPTAIIEAITGIVDGTTDDLENWSDNLHAMLGLPPLNDAIFDAGASVEQFIIDMLHPQNLLAPLVSGVVPGTNIPALDASKITSGQFPQSMLNIVSIAAGIVTGVFTTGQIPSLDASKISSGIFAQSMVDIRNIASSIVTGVFPAAQIGSLDASKVNTGIFPQSQLSITSIAASIVNGTFTATQIPSLDASKIGSGQFAQSMVNITSIAAAIVTGTLATGQIPGLDATKITSGTFPTSMSPDLVAIIQQLYNGTNILASIGKANVPKTLDQTWMPSALWPAANVGVLDASKITSGSFAQNMVTNLTTDLTNRALKSIVNSKALAGANLCVDPGFDNPDVWLYEPGAVSTEQKLTGTTSYKQIADGTLKAVSLTASGGPGQGGVYMVRPGAQYYLEASIFPKSTNVGGGSIGVISSAWDSTGVNAFTYIFQPYLGAPPAKNTWTTYAGFFTVPAGYDGIIPYVLVNSDVPVGDTFYWDRIVVKEVTRVGNSPDLQAISDHIYNGLIGGSGYTGLLGNIPDQARGGLDKIYNDVLNHTAQLQALSSGSNAEDNSGVGININFSDYPDGNLPSVFSVTYIGAGTSRLGITNGVGLWRTEVNNANLTARASYNVAGTQTDYQIIRGTLGGVPEQGGTGGTPKIGVMGRLNSTSAPTTFVWGRGYCTGFLTYKGELGTTVNNVETVWVSNIALTWSMDIRCVFGVGTQPRRYQFYSGGKLVYDYTEAGTVSQMGAGFRFFGLTADICTDSSGNPKGPGSLASAAISDNAPPNVLGSGCRLIRQNTATVTLAAATNQTDLPANYFDAIQACSADITPTLSSGRMQVTKDGWYMISIGVETTTSNSGRLGLGIKKNNAMWQWGPMLYQVNPSYSASFLGYLVAGDYISAVHANTDGFTGWGTKGQADAQKTWFSMALVNRSYA
jgi:hypothetical protein